VSNPISVAYYGFWHVHAAEYTARIQQHRDTRHELGIRPAAGTERFSVRR
jgi:hypothetical protein